MKELRYLVSEASRRPISFLLRRAWDRVLLMTRGIAGRIGMDPYRPRFRQTRRTAWTPLQGIDVEQILTRMLRTDPAAVEAVREEAHRVLAGSWDVLSHRIELTDPIPWHRDVVSGRTWPKRFHAFYSYSDLLDLDHPSDIKIPWELSRLQFLPILILCSRIDDDARFVRRARELFDGWMCANPVGWGINWTVGMEAALRLINLVWASELLEGSPHRELFPPAPIRDCVAEHGRFLFRNLEYSDISGNHYTSCLLGLLYAARFVPGEQESERWYRFAKREVHRELLRQTYPDGACHEGSIPYHRLVLELFTHARRLLSEGAEGVVDGEFGERLERMFEFTAAYAKPGGQAPVWGDADDGTVVRLQPRSINDHRYLSSIGAAIFRRADLKAAGTGLDFDSLFLLSGEEVTAYDALEAKRQRSTGRAAFPDAGYFFLRRDGDYCMVDCGDVGLRGRGGHGHNDALAVEVTLAGEHLLVDTGCAAYTRRLRERIDILRASAHNTVLVDGTEPAPIQRSRFPHASACPVQVVEWDPAGLRFVGRRLGDARIPGVEHVERSLSLDEGGQLRIRDVIRGAGRHRVEWFFHLDEGWEVEEDDASGVRVRRGTSRASIECSPLADEVTHWRSYRYPAYGRGVRRISVRLAVTSDIPLEANFVIRVRVRDGPAEPR